MFEMATVLLACGILIIVSYKLAFVFKKREWGENSKSLF